MSLLRPVIRACAVGALRDRTWAEDRVYNSDMTPLALAIYGQTNPDGSPAQKPYIVVYTDTDDLNPVTGIAEIYNGENRRLSVVMEIGVASSVRDPSGHITIQFAATDEGMELACDVIETQALAALVGDPKSAWGELFKQFVRKVYRVPSRRGGQAQQGVRFAARRTTLVVSTIYDFAPGVVPPANHPIFAFANQCNLSTYQSDIDMASILQLLETEQAPNWRVAQAYLGLTKVAVEHLNVDTVPLPWPEREEPPLDYSDTNEWVPLMTDIELHDGDKP